MKNGGNGHMDELYLQLMQLCDNYEEFFFRDYEYSHRVYRVFDYRLASYTQWLLPSALECRGITFQISKITGECIECVSRPFEKFFNLHENPFTMDLNMLTAVEVLNKMDGSLISSVNIPHDIWLKSKGAFFSDQAVAANKLINTPEYEPLREFILKCNFRQHTVIMEYCAPDNRIVLSYDKPQLTVLGVRHIDSGEYELLDNVVAANPDIEPFVVENLLNKEGFDWPLFLDTLPSMDGIEGVVVLLETGQRVKIKTEWYAALHHLKDSINFPRRLFEACVRGASDDLKSQFYDDPIAVKMILDMEVKVQSIMSIMVSSVNGFYAQHNKLSRKDYANLAKIYLKPLYFGLAMMRYTGKEINFEEFMIKHWKDYGIKEELDGTEPKSSIANW